MSARIKQSGLPLHRTSGLRKSQQDPPWVRLTLTFLAFAAVALLVVIPVLHVFYVALSSGMRAYLSNLLDDPDTRQSILLTLTVVPIAVVANTVFGLAAAWAVSRFHFKGRTLLIALIDLPFAVSPVVAGLMFVLIFGLQGYLGTFLRRDGFAVMPYLVSALLGLTAVVTCHLLARRGTPTGTLPGKLVRGAQAALAA